MKRLVLSLVTISFMSTLAVANTGLPESGTQVVTNSKLERTIKKLEKKARKDQKFSKSLTAYKEFEASHPVEKQTFITEMNDFNGFLDSKEGKTQIKEINNYCKGQVMISGECDSAIRRFKDTMQMFFSSSFVKVNGMESFRDKFFGVAGGKIWGDTYSVTIGAGLQLARSIVNFNVCALPWGGENFGVTASVVPGVGLTTGLYVGTSGICYELGLMYGLGAYAGVSWFHVIDREMPIINGRQRQQTQQEQMGTSGSEEEPLFPAMPEKRRQK